MARGCEILGKNPNFILRIIEAVSDYLFHTWLNNEILITSRLAVLLEQFLFIVLWVMDFKRGPYMVGFMYHWRL